MLRPSARSHLALTLAGLTAACGKPQAPAAPAEPAAAPEPSAAASVPAAVSPTAQAPAPKPPAPPDPACPPGGRLEVAEGIKRCLRNGFPDGPEVRFDPETGRSLADVRWKAGKKEGPAKYWDPHGNVRMETTYRDDLEEGLHRHYANGKLVWEGENHAGKAEGKWTYYRATDGTFDRMECQHEGKALWNVRDQAEGEAKKCPP